MEKIFISYKRTDKQRVTEIVNTIQDELKVHCWIDLYGINYAVQFTSIICDAIDNADVVLFMHSREHLSIDFQTDWTIKELNYAMEKGKKVILIKLDDSKLDNYFLFNFGSQNNVELSDPFQVKKLMAELKTILNICDNEQINKIKAIEMPSSSTTQTEKGEILLKAENGDPDAQYTIGWRHSQGIGGVMDYFKAVKWWQKAADNGHLKAMFEIGNCYEAGLGGLPKNYERAIDYWKAAIDRGYNDTQKLGIGYFKLGLQYKQGIGVQKNAQEAVRLWEMAVQYGNSDAMYKLAQCYKYGKGVEQDICKAVSLFQMAAEHDNDDAKKALKRMNQ